MKTQTALPSPRIAAARETLLRVIAVARLALRTAARSRFLTSMVVLLLIVALGLPAIMEGDGSLAGAVRLLLNYTLGLSAALLGAAMLWTSCASVARDIEERQIQLVAVKPVHPLELWAGKWLGLAALAGMLLAFSGMTTAILLHLRLRSAEPAEREAVDRQILCGQRVLTPLPEDVGSDVQARLDELAALGWRADVVPLAQAREIVRRELLGLHSTVSPGTVKRWQLVLPDDLPAASGRMLRVRMSPTAGEAAPITGTWRISTPGSSAALETVLQSYANGVGHIAIPPELARPGTRLDVAYHNGEGRDAGTVVFDIERGIELLVRTSGFAANLIRALLVVFCCLALICAIGLTAGSVFSFPVAAFFASSLVLLALTGHNFITAQAGESMLLAQQAASRDAVQIVGEALIRGLEHLAAPVVGQKPLALLADGILVSWARVGSTAGLLLGAYAVPLALLAAAVLRRRELAA